MEEKDGSPRPFAAVLDTGLKRTSTGSKVFAALKVRAAPLLRWQAAGLLTSSSALGQLCSSRAGQQQQHFLW